MAGFAMAILCALTLVGGSLFASSAQAATGEFVKLTESPADLTSMTVVPSSELIYAQENNGTKFFSYDPHTNEWSELAEAPINSGNNGGAAYLNGKIYTIFTENSTEVGVYDVASNSWSTIENPLGKGTGNIATVGEDLYMVVGTQFAKYNPTTEATTTLAEPPFGFEPWGGLSLYEGKLYAHRGNGQTGFAVYDIKENSWEELLAVPNGAVLGNAIDPISGTYFASGSYGERNFDRYEIAAKEWSSVELPFEVEDNGMAYVSLPGLTGIYVIQGELGTGFTRYATVEPTADLSLSMSASITPTSTGGEILYTIDVANGGPAEAANVKVSDVLPSGMTLISATSSQGSCLGTGTVSCSLGSLALEGAATVSIKVSAPTGKATNTATLTSETRDSNEANNTASISTAIAATPAPSTPAVTHCVVPGMHGLTLAGLRQALTAAHCTLGKVGHDYNRRLQKGLVIYGNPHHGAVLVEGSKVDVWVSRGSRPAKCVVPRKLHGMSVRRARKSLKAAHCRPGKVRRLHNRKVKRGQVIMVKPHHGRRRPVGHRVMIWVSKGRRK